MIDFLFVNSTIRCCGSMAEHLTRNEKVVSSILTSSSKFEHPVVYATGCSTHIWRSPGAMAFPWDMRKEMGMKKVVSGRKLYEQVLDQIQDMIAQGLYKKGDLLPTEKELMEQMGVSRITVREALRLLSEAGVISTRRGRGSVVVLDRDDMLSAGKSREDYQASFLNATKARLLLEPSLAREAAEVATEADVEALERALRGKNGGVEFHKLLMEILKNPILEQWMDLAHQYETEITITQLVPPAEQKSVAAVLAEQHEKILGAIRDHKPEFAYFYMKEHTDYILHTYEEYFDHLYTKF